MPNKLINKKLEKAINTIVEECEKNTTCKTCPMSDPDENCIMLNSEPTNLPKIVDVNDGGRIFEDNKMEEEW